MAQVWRTTGDRSSLLAEQAPAAMEAYDGTPGFHPVAIDASRTHQGVDGFGAAVTGASAWLLATEMSPGQRSALLTSLFGAEGYGLSAIRICMGSSDFSEGGYYSYDDMAGGATDPDLTSFSVATDEAFIIPVLQEILGINPAVKVVAAPWSPPGWMKDSDTLLGGNMLTANLPVYADYFVDFIEAYEAAGIPIFAVSPQNEPENSSSAYPTCLWTAPQEAAFVSSHLAPALAAAGLSTRILGYDHNWSDSGPDGFPQHLLDLAGSDLYAIAWHGYAGDVTDQGDFARANPASGQWFTEVCGETTGDFASDLLWHNHEIVIGSARAGSQGITYWNLVLDQDSQPYENEAPTTVRALVTIDSTTGDTLSMAPELYALAHSSKFVQPGAVRIHSTDYGSGWVESVGYLNPDGSKVCHLLCSAGSPQTFDLVDVGANLALGLTMQPGDVQTVVW